MNLFRLDASFTLEGSVSRAVADTLVAAARDANPELTLVRRDIGLQPLPYVLPDAFRAGRAPEGTTLTPAQQAARGLATELADEVAASDAIIVAVPLYNFGVPSQVKNWIDILFTDPRFASGAPSAIVGKPVTLVLSRGGGYGEGTPRYGWDHNTPYLERIFADVWGAEVTVIAAELTLANVVPQMEALRPMAKDLLGAAHETATQRGRHLAETALTRRAA
jgi:FMN-dependent NADH-azoreductase